MTADRLQRERDFHNQRFSDDLLRSNKVSRFYALTRTVKVEYQESLLPKCLGAQVLELGCGTGEMTLKIAESGARVISIDISQVALNHIMAQAKHANLKGSISPSRTNAEKLGFADNSFDLVFGTGILHHLEWESALREIKRVLCPDGRAVFIEPLGHNVLINMFRRSTPQIRSADEHPLTESDLAALENYFGRVDVEYFYLFALLAAPFVGSACFDWVLNFFESVDQWIFNIPFFRRHAWQVLIKLSEPHPFP